MTGMRWQRTLNAGLYPGQGARERCMLGRGPGHCLEDDLREEDGWQGAHPGRRLF